MPGVDEVTLFRAAVQGVRDCLELGNVSPALSDTLCNGFLVIVDGPDPEGQLKRFRENAKGVANGDIYLTALLSALDKATCEESAKLWVMHSVNAQLLAAGR